MLSEREKWLMLKSFIAGCNHAQEGAAGLASEEQFLSWLNCSVVAAGLKVEAFIDGQADKENG